MKAIPSLAMVIAALPLAVSCQHAAVHGVDPSGEGTIKARRLELVDSKGRTRIVMTGEDKSGGAVLSFRDTRGDPVCFALVADTDGTEHPDGEPSSAFVMEGAIGLGPTFQIFVTEASCGFSIGDSNTPEGNTISIGHANDQSYVQLGALALKSGQPQSVQLALSLEGDKVFVRDMKGKDIVSFTIPMSAITMKQD